MRRQDGGVTIPIDPKLFLIFQALALEFVGRSAQRLRNIFIAAQALEVQRVEHGQHVQANV
jgi:hypothetical protein